MPKLDGVSATSLIRKFDHMTPIISMTSNSKPNEIMSYYSSGWCYPSRSLLALYAQACFVVTGMNDILSKPFTKQSLLNMLEVLYILSLL
jgi:osomolarity two-component system response regulator SKN7